MRIVYIVVSFAAELQAEMFQEHWEEQITSSSSKGRIAPHVTSLLTLLHSHLTHHRFPEATPILETLSLATDRAPGIVWRGGREVLLHSGDYAHTLQFYRSFFKVQQWRIENLLETSFFIASDGHLDEAYDCLSSQLQINPFRSHPLCHGYCGLYQLLLHRQQHQQSTTRIKTEKEEERPAEEDSTPHITLALKHLQTVQTIDTQLPDGTANLDLFIKLLTELLEEQGEMEDALTCLLQYCHRHTLRLNPTRFVCDFLRKNHSNNVEARLRYLGDLVKLDDSCGEVLEFLQLSIDRDSSDLPRLFSTLLRFLDYPHNAATNTDAWTLLQTLQQLWPDYVECTDWTSRQSWWSRIIYPQTRNQTQN